jgi:hypothetical protein
MGSALQTPVSNAASAADAPAHVVVFVKVRMRRVFPAQKRSVDSDAESAVQLPSPKKATEPLPAGHPAAGK